MSALTLVPTKRFAVFEASSSASTAKAAAAPAVAAAAPADDPELAARLQSLLTVGEECVTEEDLRTLLTKKPAFNL